METMKTTVVESEVKVSGISKIDTQKTTATAFIQREMSEKKIADELTTRIMGKGAGSLIDFTVLYNPATNEYLTEQELTAKGAVFMSVYYDKVLGKNDIVNKSRFTGEPTPVIIKKSAYQIIANINWQSYINRRGDGNFVADDKRSNGIENNENCKAVGIKGDSYYVNGVIFKTLDKTRYFYANGQEITDIENLKNEFLKVTSKESKQKEADKHGIAVEFDPQYRTTKIDSCKCIRAFGFEYIPTKK